MPNTFTWTPAERWQALQNLESALGEPDTNMFFTYNGHSYRSVGVNADGTMQVIDQTTGQMTTLDPVDVYGAFQAASGNPTPSLQIITPPKPIGTINVSAVMSQIGQYSGLVPLINEVLKLLLQKLPLSLLNLNVALSSKLLSVLNFLRNPIFGAVLGGVSAAIGAYGVFTGVQSLYKNGVTPGGVLNVGMSAFGVATGLNMAYGQSMFAAGGWFAAAAVVSASFEYAGLNDLVLHGFSVKGLLSAGIGFAGVAAFTNLMIGAAAFGPLGLAVAAAVALFSVIWSLLHQPPPEQIAAQNLTQALSPIIWTPGPLVVVAVGTVAILMGWAKNQTPPAMASLTVPAYYVNQVLAASGVPAVDLKSKTPAVIVEPGDGRVVIVSPNGTADSHGDPLVTLQTYVLAKNLQFISSPNIPPGGAYIPFFRIINGKLSTEPNPELVKALTIQDKLLQAVLSGTLLTRDALNALIVAAASNKYGVGPAH